MGRRVVLIWGVTRAILLVHIWNVSRISRKNVTFYLICQVSESFRSSHPVMHHNVRNRLLGNIFTLAATDMLTLLDSQTNHFSQKKKERKEMKVSDLHAFLGQSIVTLACQLLRMSRVIHVWWQNTASLMLTTTLTTTGPIGMGRTADETFLGAAWVTSLLH